MAECPFTDAVVDQISARKPNSMVIAAGLFHGQVYAYRPPGVALSRYPFLNILTWKCRSARLAYLFYPLFMILSYPVLFSFYLWLGLRFRVRSILIFDHQQAVMAGLLRRLGLFRRVVYFTGDWYPGSSFLKGIWTRLNNEVYFPALDWLACKLCDVTINQTVFVEEGRKKYWGRQVSRTEVGFQPPLVVKTSNGAANPQSRKLAFLGAARPDSGLDLVVRALPRVREQIGDVSLKIIGPPSDTIDKVMKLAKELGVASSVEYLGVGDYATFATILADCYCGVNMISDPNSYSARAIPAKILDYLQYLLPPLVTAGVGVFGDAVREHKLGLVIAPTVDATVDGLVEVFKSRAFFVQNIRTFIKERSSTDLVELLCPESDSK